ncbi:MAG: hypothetical protein HFJ52_04095 [Clostridia bacterium]|nr:hypothetical protein [Clostridia bacterium]
METIVKYRVEIPFKDKYTKEDITANTLLEISIERMKELNVKKIGRVEDIIVKVDEQETEISENQVTNENTKPKEPVQNEVNKYTQEQLEAMSVNQLKELAEHENIELTKAKKDEIVAEILAKM